MPPRPPRVPVRGGQRLILAMAIALVPAPSLAQFPPDSFTNLEVLPQDIGQRELVRLMGSFTRALGVRCTFCHVGEEGQPLSTYDFPSDEKLTKRKARVMLRMVRHINAEHLGKLEERSDPPVEVECATCHRGVEQPRMLEELLLEAYEVGGIGAAVQRYAELRERYYGSYSYDFRAVPLVDVAQELGARHRLGDAVRLLALNVEHNPNSVFALRSYVRAELEHTVLERGSENGVQRYHELRSRYTAEAFPEFLLNGLGYSLLRAGRIQDAITIFRLNVEQFPAAFNTYDSLAEAYLVAGDTTGAITNYQRSVELNPDNANGIRRLERLTRERGEDE